VIPQPHLNRISTGVVAESLQAFVGRRAVGSSSQFVVRPKEQVCDEHEGWSNRDLGRQQDVYIWADGIHTKVRLEVDANRNPCLLVLVRTMVDGQQGLIVVLDGYRESEQSGRKLLPRMNRRGLLIAMDLAVGAGALRIWATLREMLAETREQCRWIHKTANVPNKMPKSVQPKSRIELHEIWQAGTNVGEEKAFSDFFLRDETKYPLSRKDQPLHRRSFLQGRIPEVTNRRQIQKHRFQKLTIAQ